MLGYGQLPREFGSHLPDNITPQTWVVGAVLGDIVIALCMTYYVGFLKFLRLDFGEKFKSHSLFTMPAFAM